MLFWHSSKVICHVEGSIFIPLYETASHPVYLAQYVIVHGHAIASKTLFQAFDLHVLIPVGIDVVVIKARFVVCQKLSPPSMRASRVKLSIFYHNPVGRVDVLY